MSDQPAFTGTATRLPLRPAAAESLRACAARTAARTTSEDRLQPWTSG